MSPVQYWFIQGKGLSLYTQIVGRTSCQLNGWLKVNGSQKQEVWIKSMVAKDNCELGCDKIFCANAKVSTNSKFFFVENRGWSQV